MNCGEGAASRMSDNAPVSSQAIFAMLMESRFWADETMLSYQRSQLEQLLRHAKANVPFYKSRLDVVFKNNGQIDWDKWTDIPVLTREDIRACGAEMRTTTIPRGHGPVAEIFTSGSSGVPIKILATHLSNTIRESLWRRMYSQWRLPPNLRHAECKIRLRDGQLFERPYQWVELKNPSGHRKVLYLNRRLPAEERLNILQSEGIEVLVDMPHGITLLADQNDRLSNPVRLRAVVTFGGTVSEAEMKSVAKSFQGSYLVPYSSKEGGLIAGNCPVCGAYHVNAEAVWPEFITETDSSGTSRPTMLVTPLFSTAQPLIRYRQEDIVEPCADELPSCQSGNRLPRFGKVTGRVDPIFHFDGQAFVPHTVNESMIVELLRASAFQIAQTGKASIEVRYVSKSIASSETMSWIENNCREAFSQQLHVVFKKLVELPFGPGGKQNRYVRENF